MRTLVPRLGFLSIAIVAAAAHAKEPPAAQSATIAVAPLVMSMPSRPGRVALLGPDGIMRDKATGRPLVKIVGNEIQTADGQWIVRLGADGKVTTRMKEVDKRDGVVTSERFSENLFGKLTAKDELLLTRGGKLWFDDKTGAVTSDEPKGIPELKLEGVTAKNRRAALLLYVAALAPATMTNDVKDVH
jgi:hypothetical protein